MLLQSPLCYAIVICVTAVIIVGHGRAVPLGRATGPEPAFSRSLRKPARLTLRQTRRAAVRAEQTALRTLKVGHLNVRSLTAHLDEVNHLIHT